MKKYSDWKKVRWTETRVEPIALVLRDMHGIMSRSIIQGIKTVVVVFDVCALGYIHLTSI